MSILATPLFATPVDAASTEAAISIADVAHLNPTAFSFPSGGAFSFRPGTVTVSQGGTAKWNQQRLRPAHCHFIH